MTGTAIIDATTTTVVSLQSFLGSGLPLSGERSSSRPARVKVHAPIRGLVCTLTGASVAATTGLDQGQLRQVGTQILADMDDNKAALVAAQTSAINTARGVLNYSLYMLQNYRGVAQELSYHPSGGRQLSNRLQMVVCGTVVRGALAACDSLACPTPLDAARIQATTLILAEVLQQLHAE